jgi:hypothetical protein
VTDKELLEAALKEAYASAPQDEIILHALEINHRSFTEPIRVIQWPVTGPEPDRFKCLLEADAPYNPGQVVTFIGLPFDLVPPEKSTENMGQFQIRVENVGDILDEHLEAASLNGGTITAIYREFLKGSEEVMGPVAIWGDIKIISPRPEGQAIVFDGAVLDWMFRKFGRLTLPSDYPALVTGR